MNRRYKICKTSSGPSTGKALLNPTIFSPSQTCETVPLSYPRHKLIGWPFFALHSMQITLELEMWRYPSGHEPTFIFTSFQCSNVHELKWQLATLYHFLRVHYYDLLVLSCVSSILLALYNSFVGSKLLLFSVSENNQCMISYAPSVLPLVEKVSVSSCSPCMF